MDYYEILEVTPAASDEVIKMAYRALAKKYHPDVYAGDAKYAQVKMSEINRAYEILSDPKKREEYDRARSSEKNNFSYSAQEQRSYTNTTETASSDPPHNPKSNTQPEPTRKANTSGFSIFRGLWKVAKAAIVILIIYGIFSGKLIPLVKNVFNPSETATQHVAEPVNNEPVDETAKAIEDAVSDYMVCLQKIDAEGAQAHVQGQRLYDVTDVILGIYSELDVPDGMGYEMMKEARKFTYSFDDPIISSDNASATVNVKIQAPNLYAVMTIAQMSASDKLSNEDWVNQYVIESALSGNTDASEEEVLNDCIKEALKIDIDKLQFNVRFSLTMVDGKWIISEITDDKSFTNAVTGKLVDMFLEARTGTE